MIKVPNRRAPSAPAAAGRVDDALMGLDERARAERALHLRRALAFGVLVVCTAFALLIGACVEANVRAGRAHALYQEWAQANAEADCAYGPSLPHSSASCEPGYRALVGVWRINQDPSPWVRLGDGVARFMGINSGVADVNFPLSRAELDDLVQGNLRARARGSPAAR